jgi:acyl-CoA thioester hydrolase
MVHTTEVKVRFGELDPYNHANHSVYVVWFEVGRTEALESIGCSLHDMGARGFQVVVTEITVRYRVAAQAGDRLTIETWVDEVGGARSIWSQRLLRGDTVLSEATVKAGATDATGRPTRIPADIKAAFATLLR